MSKKNDQPVDEEDLSQIPPDPLRPPTDVVHTPRGHGGTVRVRHGAMDIGALMREVIIEQELANARAKIGKK